MDRILALAFFLLAIIIAVITYPDQAAAIIVAALCSSLVLIIIQRSSEDTNFLQRIFLGGLLLRLLFGIFIYATDLTSFFGSDAMLYHRWGEGIYAMWFDESATSIPLIQNVISFQAPGWGMGYFVAFVYVFTGPNMLAAQFVCAVVGAATPPMVYRCAKTIFNNGNVGKSAAMLVAFFPAMIIWSSQLLKDGLIIFLLVLTITAVLKLREKFQLQYVVLLVFSMGVIMSLRFYIFYMLAVAVVGSFLVGFEKSLQSVATRLAGLVIVGIALTYIGGSQSATDTLDKYATLERVQTGRLDQSQTGESGFGKDIDVSTPEGAISAIPIGFTYLMFAPFPWQATNLRQAISLPEVLVWWSMMPAMVFGLIYAVRKRLSNTIPVLVFTILLTLGYSVFQGNVGTAYRQRTQIQVFMMIFIAAGWELKKEKKENERIERRL